MKTFDTSINQGKALFTGSKYNCSLCHGAQGQNAGFKICSYVQPGCGTAKSLSAIKAKVETMGPAGGGSSPLCRTTDNCSEDVTQYLMSLGWPREVP
jgi:hypothetical protein